MPSTRGSPDDGSIWPSVRLEASPTGSTTVAPPGHSSGHSQIKATEESGPIPDDELELPDEPDSEVEDADELSDEELNASEDESGGAMAVLIRGCQNDRPNQ
jgi:hypothetical protein